MEAYLLLDDGTKFYGTAFGADVAGNGPHAEIAFETKMPAYFDGLADAAFKDRLLVLTCPLIIDGVEDGREDKPCVKGLIVKELSDVPSNWKIKNSLDGFLKENGIVGIKGVDTRALVIKIRNKPMRGKICFCGE